MAGTPLPLYVDLKDSLSCIWEASENLNFNKPGTHNFAPLERSNTEGRCFISSVILALGQSGVIFEMCVAWLWIAKALGPAGEETVRESRALKESMKGIYSPGLWLEKKKMTIYVFSWTWVGRGDDGHSTLASQRQAIPAGQSPKFSVIWGSHQAEKPLKGLNCQQTP